MYTDVVEDLICPICKSKIRVRKIYLKDNDEVIEGTLCCENNHKFYIKHGVIDFHYKENTNTPNLSEFYFERNFKELNKIIEQKTPDNLKKVHILSKNYISAIINKIKPKIVLDIASGRSILLETLAEKVNCNLNVISTDLNFATLKYNRERIKKINSNIKITYIACDYLKLPIKDNTVECVTSFYGFPNLTVNSPYIMKECGRILKNKGLILDSRIVVNEKDDYFNKIKAATKQNLGFPNPEIVAVEEKIKEIYSSIGFSEYKCETIGESIGEKNELDIIPAKGEKFKACVIISKK
ncbi:class I SAM-dependent methyltransferase [Clostridium ihumii]|uniref:class I SAM-dependent methyltransferase n=1 Tax=Clostridium ihumii TaxID=1470356 RepID=UPI003D3357C5